MGRFLQHCDRWIAPGHDYIWSERNQFFGPRVDAFGILACETVIKSNVSAFDPAKFMKALLERQQPRNRAALFDYLAGVCEQRRTQQ